MTSLEGVKCEFTTEPRGYSSDEPDSFGHIEDEEGRILREAPARSSCFLVDFRRYPSEMNPWAGLLVMWDSDARTFPSLLLIKLGVML